VLTADLDYHLPDALIATTPAEPRDSARLMVCDRATGQATHHHVRDLPTLGLLKPGDLVLANRSRVVPARFAAVRAKTGGKAAGLFLGESDQTWTLMLETRGKPEPGEVFTLTDDASLQLIEPLGHGEWRAALRGNTPTLALLEQIGATPLPPYIRKARKHRDETVDADTDPSRYNTVYAQEPGSVAAPTAGLHFTPDLLAQLEAQGVRRAEVLLHVGLGTFAPVRTDRIEDHDIHEERITIPPETIAALQDAKAAGQRTLTVGTTTVRALESLPDNTKRDGKPEAEPFTTKTSLFITPDRVASGAFTWRHTDMLLTNFHLPKSTLLAMVAALPGVGLERLMGWYAEAIEARYRFYSYGDAMVVV